MWRSLPVLRLAFIVQKVDHASVRGGDDLQRRIHHGLEKLLDVLRSHQFARDLQKSLMDLCLADLPLLGIDHGSPAFLPVPQRATRRVHYSEGGRSIKDAG